jgi:hypothetical protein
MKIFIFVIVLLYENFLLHRSKSASSNGETINDVEALKSLYEIYLRQHNENRYKRPSIVRFRRLSESDANIKPSSKHRHIEIPTNTDIKEVIRSASSATRRTKSSEDKRANFRPLPITKVEFIREEHIKSVAERRKKCKGLTPRTDYPCDEVLWNRFGLSPVSCVSGNQNSNTNTYVLVENLDYELTSVLKSEGYSDIGEDDDSLEIGKSIVIANTVIKILGNCIKNVKTCKYGMHRKSITFIVIILHRRVTYQ